MADKIINKTPLRLTKQLASVLLRDIDNFLFDCDGVIWNWPKPIHGSIECINKLKSLGKKCFFITNNSTKTRNMIVEQMNSIGIENVHEDDIVCTAWVLAGYLKSINFKDKCYVIGNSSIAFELDAAGIQHCGIGSTTDTYPDPSKYDFKKNFTLDPKIKCVVVGFDYHFNYPKMLIATTYAYQPNCMFIATNDDAVFPSGSDSKVVIPGTGTFVNALRTSINRDPLILGKPHHTMWSILKVTHNINENNTCMIGDRLETDIAFGNHCKLRYTLAVLSGITNEKEILNLANNNNNEGSEGSSSTCINFKNNNAILPDFYTDSLRTLGEYI